MTGGHGGVIGVEPRGPIAAFLTGRSKSLSPEFSQPFMEGALMEFDEGGGAVSIRCFRDAPEEGDRQTESVSGENGQDA
jgi:calcineurin-like phosphoesterase